MKICEDSEAFVEAGGDLVFDHTKIILQNTNDEYYYARVPHRLNDSSNIDLRTLDLVPIPVDNIWPKANPDWTQVPEPLPDNVYLKQPSLMDYGESDASLRLDEHILNEAEVCEILKQNPHPNIATYRGCVVRGGRIRGLCFDRYPQTLSQRIKDRSPLDINVCMEGIERGVAHLHGLGLIHNDLNPNNIMMDGEGQPVIIDFDSCKPTGKNLGLKAGTMGWEPETKSSIARPENDEHGVAKLREWLVKETGIVS